MDKIVSLARRRGFVFPSSEIYGGLGSSYDYGHYGVLLKDNVKARWLEAMVRERDDIVALDSSIILHPAVWEASGHVAGFAYSPAMLKSGLTWDEATLDKYLANPMKTVPGTKMVFPGLSDAAQRKAVIEYLKTL